MNADRRHFLKMALFSGAATALSQVISFKEALSMVPSWDLKGCTKHVTGCMWCQCGCSMIVYVKDGKAVHVTGNPHDPLTRGMICMKPIGSIRLLNSTYRLKRPLKRVSGRGGDAKVVEIGWNEALDEIASRLTEIRNRYGGHTLGVWASGRSAFDARYISKALCRLFGTRNWEKTGPFCNYSGKIGTETVVGTRNTPWIYTDDDFFSADTYVLLGSNMAATKPVIFRRLMEKKKAGGCRLVVVDPRRSETAEVSDWHLPIRPGTDMALGLALSRYLIERGLYDKKFIKNYSTGFRRYKEFLMKGPYDLEWASTVTGLEREDIKHLANIIAKSKNLIMVANAGISHHVNAVHTHRVFSMLAAMTGRYGRKGNGFACLNNGASKIGSLPVPKERIPRAKKELGKNPVMWLESVEDPSYPYRLRALISTGTPLIQWPQQKRIRRLVSRLNLSMANEIVPNICSRYFDFMLPAAFWIEAGGLAPVSDESRFVWCPKLIEPPGEAKPDRWWWIELGKRLGYEDVFTDELKDPVYLQDLCAGQRGYTVKNFVSRPDNSLRAPITIKKGSVCERGSLFVHKKFFTPSKKVEFWTRGLKEKFHALGLPLFADFYTDPLLAGSSLRTVEFNQEMVPSPFQKNKTLMFTVSFKKTKADDSAYPFLLTTGKPSEAIMGHTCHWIRLLHTSNPVQECWIHPEAAKAFCIRHGQRIRVRSPLGVCIARARLTNGIRRDTLFIPNTFGKGIPFNQKSGDFETVNFLTDLDSRCPVSSQVAFKGIRANVEPADKGKTVLQKKIG